MIETLDESFYPKNPPLKKETSYTNPSTVTEKDTKEDLRNGSANIDEDDGSQTYL